MLFIEHHFLANKNNYSNNDPLDLVIGAELSELLKEYKGGKHRLGNKQRPKHNLEQVIILFSPLHFVFDH